MRAIILAAGAGTRLRDKAAIKPLAVVAGKTLLAHAMDGMAQAGVSEIIIVTGYEAEQVVACAHRHATDVPVHIVHNSAWEKPNGTSVLAARDWVQEPTLLAMCDHLVDPALYRVLMESPAPPEALVLGIDRRLHHPWIDLEDVTCVRTEANRIVDIGKGLEPHDCYDVGVFRISSALMRALAAAPQPSLSDGVRALAAQKLAYIVDIGTINWIDVDDPRAMRIAEEWLQS